MLVQTWGTSYQSILAKILSLSPCLFNCAARAVTTQNTLKMGSHTTSTLAVDVDKITPVYAFDDTALNRVMPVCQVLRFLDILDPDVLRTSLETLLEIGDWKKLRGRWRIDVGEEIISGSIVSNPVDRVAGFGELIHSCTARSHAGTPSNTFQTYGTGHAH